MTPLRKESGEVLAEEVEVRRGFLGKARGLMFRRSVPEDYALVLEFDREKRVNLHMLFVPFDIDALLLDGEGVVSEVERLEAWTGRIRGRAAAVVELPAGGGASVEEGDRLVWS